MDKPAQQLVAREQWMSLGMSCALLPPWDENALHPAWLPQTWVGPRFGEC